MQSRLGCLCPWYSVPLCHRALVLRHLWCLDAPCIGALGASVPSSLVASVLRHPCCSRACLPSVLQSLTPRCFAPDSLHLGSLVLRRSLHRYPQCKGALVPRCFGTLGAPEPPCLGASAHSVLRRSLQRYPRALVPQCLAASVLRRSLHRYPQCP
ncbi:UNVERIFIED_CONTAM: hypothetical protein FKN15_010143 [Acipenser sinensis]